MAAAGVRGKRSREARRLDSPTWLVLRWSEAAGLRERAAAATGVRRGGAAAEERRAVGVSEVREVGAELGGGVGALYSRWKAEATWRDAGGGRQPS